MDNGIYRFIAFFCAISLLLLLLLLIPMVVQGDYSKVSQFFVQYPGSEPFIIFILPVILIGGTAWIWQQFKR